MSEGKAGRTVRARQLDRLAERPSIGTLFAGVCDLNGTLRGKRHGMDAAAELVDGSARMSLSLAGLDIWGEDVAGGEHANSVFAPRLRAMPLDCKRQERARFDAHVNDLDYRSYLETV